MKKTIITILLTAAILYMLGMMSFFPPKTEAAGYLWTPFDDTILCCMLGYDECCALNCQDRYCFTGDPMCFVDKWDIIQSCVNVCLQETGSLCYELGYR